MFRYRFIRTILNGVRLMIASMDVHGRENIPPAGPYIVVLNHVSVADTPILLITFPIVRWRFFAGEKWRTHWLYGPIMSWLGAIYINRGEADRKALKVAMNALKSGVVFGLAPEGSRSKGGKMKPAKDGAAYLASRANVPILPVGLVNLDVLFANARQLKRTPIEVHVGEPFLLPDLGHRAKGPELTAYTHLIMCHLAALLPPRYHGVFADSPALKAIQAGDDPWPACLAMAGAVPANPGGEGPHQLP